MALTPRPRFAPGDTITSAWANILDDDFTVLDLRTGGDPGAADKMLVSNGALGAAWGQLTLALIPTGLITDDKLHSGIDADTLGGRTPGTTAGEVAFYSGAGKVVAAIEADHADSADNATTAAGRSVGTTAGEVAFYDGSNQVVDSAKLGGSAAALYAKLAAPALTGSATLNGDAIAVMTRGTYSGGGSADRTIATGFTCKHVSLMGVFGSTTVLFLEIRSTTVSENIGSNFRFSGSPAASLLQMSTATKLDASDGFHVNGTGLDGTDNAGATYYWTAWG